MKRTLENHHRRIYVFRHGQTDWNKEGRIQGHLDIPLNESGRSQAVAMGLALKRYLPEAFLSSDLSRAWVSAELAAQQISPSLPIEKDQRLREIHLGVLQGKTKAEIERDHGIDFSNRLRNKPLSDADVAAVGSESGQQVFQRAIAAIVDYLEQKSFARIAVATHGGVIRRLIQYSHKLNAEKEDYPAPIPNGIIYPFFVDLEKKVLLFSGQSELILEEPL
jgi:probable phosphoglycerate mutase